MTLSEFLAILKECPLIASVQASPGSPLDDTETLLKLAQASVSQGVRILRLEGVENIKRIREATRCPTIGLIKRKYPDSELYITPTMREVEELIETGCEVIAIDGTPRTRPSGANLSNLVSKIHDFGRIVLADCDSHPSVRHSLQSGCDMVSTTLAGYTPDTTLTDGPDLGFLIESIKNAAVPVIAEGRYQGEDDLRMAMAAGAKGVVVGGALNDPVKQTSRFVLALRKPSANIGAIDIGGTWIRFGLFDSEWNLLEKTTSPRHESNIERLRWIRSQAMAFGVNRLGISSGGVVDPKTSLVRESKETIPDNEGFFNLKDNGYQVFPLNDGLATAWGHACHPLYLGKRTFTLSIGTGVGAGFVVNHRIEVGRGGEYPRINDLSFKDGKTVEETLGGLAISTMPDGNRSVGVQQSSLNLHRCVDIINSLYFPDVVVLAGSVAMNPAVSDLSLTSRRVALSPFGEDAGLYGAAALALFPPIGVFPE